jgi:hypothetical protein
MAVNTIPIYSKAGQIGNTTAALTAANTARDGTGTVQTIFTAGADGGRVERVRVTADGTNVATVLRIFINNGGATTTATNNVLYAEMTLPATTASAVAALTTQELPNTTDTTAFPLVLPPNYRLTAVIGTAVAAGVRITAIGSTYTA